MVTYTNSSLYWSPLKPRINIYALDDISYSSPLYTYNPFTDVGTSTKPVSLSFDSQTTNAGSFSLEIEDADSELDFDTFTKGNRVVIDCSKNGSTWQYAFKGLIRSSEQTIYAPTGRNFTLSGYSYIVRLNERVLNVVKESSLDVNQEYDRTDTNMFTNNLVENLLDDDQNYVFSSDDSDLYTLPSPADISTSSIQEWLPRLDAELVTVGSAIDSVLEYSNSLITVDLSTDKWAVYNPDLIQPLTQVFLCTDNMNQAADDGDITMYPLAPYKYNVSYDYPDSGSRLIVALNTGGQCPETEPTESSGLVATYTTNEKLDFWVSNPTFDAEWLACSFNTSVTSIANLRISLGCIGNFSSVTSTTARIYTNSGSNLPNTQVGSDMTLYKDSTLNQPWPNVSVAAFVIGQLKNVDGPSGLTRGNTYWLAVRDQGSNSSTHNLLWICNAQPDVSRGAFASAPSNPPVWVAPTPAGNIEASPIARFEFAAGGSEACGGSLTTEEIPEPQFVVAHDLNATNRLGIVERAITSLPRHITTLQTINEYLYAKLYVSAKPRFTFDFPSVSMPGKIPKAGDIVTHVSRRAGVGLKTAPLQTGVIMSVNYDFAQDGEGVLGLRKMGLQSTGIRRGSY